MSSDSQLRQSFSRGVRFGVQPSEQANVFAPKFGIVNMHVWNLCARVRALHMRVLHMRVRNLGRGKAFRWCYKR